MSAGVYLHIPFCLKKCGYCDFYSLPVTAAYAAGNACARYAAMLSQAVAMPFLGERRKADTLYIGGGTPTVLGQGLVGLLGAARRAYSLDDSAQITIEANPATVDYSLLAALRQAGADRLSIGVQSADDSELLALGRAHSFDDARRTVADAKRAGFGDISVDLITGLPGQTKATLRKTLEAFISLEAAHISAYMLKIEEGTAFYRDNVAARCPDDDAQAELYLYTAEFLAQHGYEHYEISNFARDKKYSRHNLKYWKLEEYIGLGPSAHSFVGGKRYSFERDLADFERQCAQGELHPRCDGEGGGLDEYIMLRLRLKWGIEYEDIRAKYGADTSGLRTAAERLPKNLVNITESGVSLTPEGFLVSNYIIGLLTEAIYSKLTNSSC